MHAGTAVSTIFLVIALLAVSDSSAEKPPFEITPEKPSLVFSPPNLLKIPRTFTVKANQNSLTIRLSVLRLTHEQNEVLPTGVSFLLEGQPGPLAAGTSVHITTQLDSKVLYRPGRYTGYFIVEEEKPPGWIARTGQIEFFVTRPEASLKSLPDSLILRVYRICLHSWTPLFCGNESKFQLVAFDAPVHVEDPIPARLSSERSGLTCGRVVASILQKIIPIGQPVDLTLQVEELYWVGKYNGSLLVDGQGLKEPLKIQTIVLVTDGAFGLAIAIAVGVLLSYYRKRDGGLSVIGFMIAIATGMTAQNFLGQDYFGSLEHYLLAFVWGATTDITVKSQRVRQFLGFQ